MSDHPPVSVAVLNDYELVVAGVTRMLQPYADRVRVVEQAANLPVSAVVDVALYDTFAQPVGDGLDQTVVLSQPRARKLVAYSWQHHQDAVEALRANGVDGFVPKHADAAELVSVIERVHSGEVVWPDPSSAPVEDEPVGGDWPGRAEGLSAREAEIIALIVQGLSNVEVAARAYLSVNTIKSYIRSAYRKMGVQSRSQAVLWGIDHGFRPDQVRDSLDA